jgi:hypothetical protein
MLSNERALLRSASRFQQWEGSTAQRVQQLEAATTAQIWCAFRAGARQAQVQAVWSQQQLGIGRVVGKPVAAAAQAAFANLLLQSFLPPSILSLSPILHHDHIVLLLDRHAQV